jgi:Protein of unknown function (DUF4240)
VDLDTFWGIIGTARSATTAEKPFHLALTDCLKRLPEPELLDYQIRFDDLHVRLYRWDVWAAAYLIGGGCSDDSFIDFRYGIIAQGRDWYERTPASPDNLGGHPDVRDGRSIFFYELAGYAAPDACEANGGDVDDFYNRRNTREHALGMLRESDVDMGEDFDFDDHDQMRRRLPRLAAILLPAPQG